MTRTTQGTTHRVSGELGDYLKSICDQSRITADEELTLALAWKDHGCRESRERLVTANLRLVIMVAKRYMGRGIPLDELVAEGNIGLLNAVDNFDPYAGARLSTYAVYWIRHAVTEAFAKGSTRSRMSRAERADVIMYERAIAHFALTHGRAPVCAEICGLLCWHPEKVRTVESLCISRARPQSLHDATVSAVDLADESASADLHEGSADPAARIPDLLCCLAPDERQIVELRFGLDGAAARSIGVIAETVGQAPRVVRVRLESALRKLSRRIAGGFRTPRPENISVA